MTLIGTYIKSVSEQDKIQMINDFEEFEKNHSIGECFLREHAERWIGSLSINVVFVMELMTKECYRHFAHLYLDNERYITGMNIPKEWYDWLDDAGFHIDCHRYYKGFGRYWRVNIQGMLEVSEPFETFDRWANSSVAECPLPQTKEQFEATVKWLLNQTKEYDETE